MGDYVGEGLDPPYGKCDLDGHIFHKKLVIHEIHPIEGMNFMQGGSRPSPTVVIHCSDKLKFE